MKASKSPSGLREVRLLALAVCFTLAACGGGKGGGGDSPTSGPTSAPTPAPPASGSAPSPAPSPVAALTFPIEVLGDGDPGNPVIAAVDVALDAGSIGSAAQMVVRTHRVGFYNSPEFQALSKPITRVGGSMRIVGAAGNTSAPWIDITDANVQLNDVERVHGGVNGAMVTIRFRVQLDDATRARLVGYPATNRIEFRFNGTDGNSNGYRVLDLQLQDGTGKDLIQNAHQWADIGAQKTAGKAWTPDADLGKTLWTAQNVLVKSPIVPMTLRASCSACHASDGRDIQYFNYSDNAIVQRSRFHGLSEAQGKQIVAYLRSSLYATVPYVAQATPWNPPYQPGAGLDSKPVVEWAAGAGIDAVLPDAKSFINAFVGKAPGSTAAVTQADVDAAMDPSPGKVLNTRELPVALQFPDWNSWLPIEHPLDIWTPDAGQTAGLFETQGNSDSNPVMALQRISDFLAANKNPNGVYGDWTHLTPGLRDQVQNWLGALGGSSIGFVGGGRGSRISPDPTKPYGGEIGAAKLQALMSAKTTTAASMPAAFTKEAFVERALFGMIHWMGVKQWELSQTYGLEGPQSVLHGTRDSSGNWVGSGEQRGWQYSWPSVFYVAPHMLAVPQGNRDDYFSWEPQLTSYYRTNQWYQLQMTLNPGWAGASNGPIDWPYHMVFTESVSDELIGANAPPQITAMHLARFFAIRTKLAQLANTNIPLNQPDPTDPTNLYKNLGMQSKADLVDHKLGVGEVVDRGPDISEQTRFRLLDSVAPGTHVMFINGSISLYNKLYSTTTYGQWRRCDGSFSGDPVNDPEAESGFRFCLDVKRTPLPLNSNGQQHLVGGWNQWTTEQFTTWGIISAKNHGADPVRLKTLSDWDNLMWPN